MTTKVDKTVVVNVPLSTVYNQWTQFEDFPHFMGGVESVRQVTDKQLEWKASIGGVSREWTAEILRQEPDEVISWAATEGATNTGTVTFRPASPDSTEVHLELEYEPEDWVEKVGDKLNVVENRAEKDLERFKEFIESEDYATGAWRGRI
ncbi:MULTISPECIES: SRPBCC family protein, partial [Nesterenkonia]|uniref:SRPBCC family protein n=1 Tax=Nesterenkonia rhizosphaerae TaxID=1348272 RepID=A0ABP9FPS1_9MICC